MDYSRWWLPLWIEKSIIAGFSLYFSDSYTCQFSTYILALHSQEHNYFPWDLNVSRGTKKS